VQIMVDDAAAIVIMLSPEPKLKAENLQAPAAASVASVSNHVANSAEAQNFFRHLQLVTALADHRRSHFDHAAAASQRALHASNSVLSDFHTACSLV
jgi:hypothetical protein